MAKFRLGLVDGEIAENLREILNAEGISVAELTNRLVNGYLDKEIALDKSRQNLDKSRQGLDKGLTILDKAIEKLDGLSDRVTDLEAISQISDSRINNLEVENVSKDSDIENKINGFSNDLSALKDVYSDLSTNLRGIQDLIIQRLGGFKAAYDSMAKELEKVNHVSDVNLSGVRGLGDRVSSVENDLKTVKESVDKISAGNVAEEKVEVPKNETWSQRRGREIDEDRSNRGLPPRSKSRFTRQKRKSRFDKS